MLRAALLLISITSLAFGQATFSGAAHASGNSSISSGASVPTAVTITTGSPLPNGTQNVAYTVSFNATGGTLPYTWAKTTGSFPSGLTLSGNTLSGTDASAETQVFTMQVTDSSSPTQTAIAQFSLTIQAAAIPLQITTTSLPSGFQNVSYSQTLNATGGTPPYTWSLSSGSLPTGLTMNASTGVIAGTPTVVQTASFTALVTDSLNATDTQALSITINPNNPPPPPPGLPALPQRWMNQNEWQCTGNGTPAAYGCTQAQKPTYISCLSGASWSGHACSSADAYTTGTYPYPVSMAGLVQAMSDAEARRIDKKHVYGAGQTGPGSFITIPVGAVITNNGGTASIQLKNGPSGSPSTNGSNPDAPCLNYSGQNGSPFIASTCPSRYTGVVYNVLTSDNPGPSGVRVGFREITSISRSANVVTVVTRQNHTLVNGDYVYIERTKGASTSFNSPLGCNWSGCSGPITVDSATQFHYSQTGPPESGTVVALLSDVAAAHPPAPGDPHTVTDDVASYMYTIQLGGLDNRCHNPDPGASHWAVTNEECDYRNLDEFGNTGGNHLSMQSGASHPHSTDINGNLPGQSADLANHIIYQRNYAHGHDSIDSSAIAITSLTCTSGVVSATAPGIITGNTANQQTQITIAGVTPSGFNGTYVTTPIGTNGTAGTFQFALTCPAASGSGGTAVEHVATFTSRVGQCGGSYEAWADNYYSQIHIVGNDSHTLGANNCLGPYKYTNNYLEAAGENTIVGGVQGDQVDANGNIIPNAVDIEDRLNWYNKPYAVWYGNPIDGVIHTGTGFNPGNNWSIKNLYELKDSTRMVTDADIFTYNWVQAQTGSAFLWAPRTCSGACSSNTSVLNVGNERKVIRDVTVTNNILAHSAQGLQIGGRSDGPQNGERVSYPTRLIYMKNNLWFDIGNTSAYGAPGNTPYGWTEGSSGQGYHCTITESASGLFATVSACTPNDGISTRTGMSPGDPVYITGCTQTAFNTPVNTLGPPSCGPGVTSTNGGSCTNAPATSPDTLTLSLPWVATPNLTDSSGTCQLNNYQGSPFNIAEQHDTLIAATPTVTPKQLSNLPRMPLGTSVIDNNFVNTAGISCAANEGTTAEACFDLTTFNFYNDLYQGRTAANYTEYGGAHNGASPPVTIIFPANISCSGATANSTCVGMSAFMNGAAYNSNLSDWHGYSLVATSPGHNAASDGKDMGADFTALDNALTSPVYTCPYTCGSPGPYTQ